MPAAWIPYLVAGALTLALSLVLLALDARDRVNRVFAAFLFFRGVGMIVGPWRTSGAEGATVVLNFLPYALIPLVPLLAYFAFAYPKPRGPARFRGAGIGVAALVVALEAAYFFAHDSVWTFEATTAPPTFATAAPGVDYTSFGPLVLLIGLVPLTNALVGLAFARNADAAVASSRRYSAILVSAGFTLNALFDATNLLVALRTLVVDGEPFLWWPWGWAYVVFPALAAFPAVAAVFLVVRHGERHREDRGWSLRFAAGAALAVGSALGVAALGNAAVYRNLPLAGFAIGAWRLVLPALVTYALLRHQLFDIDLKVKAGLRASTVAAAFLAVFFTVSELAANVIQETVGTVLGIGAAVGMAFALRPVERMAEGLAHRIMPGVRPVENLRPDERETFYREQLELALEDGNLGAKERAMLDKLRERLGLSPDATRRIEAGYTA